MSSARPRIGLAPCFFHADPTRAIFKGKTLLYLEESLAHWLQRAGALPFLLPTPGGEIGVRDLLAEMDGLVLQGGSDVAPGSYGEAPLRPEWAGDAVRDRYEIELVRACLEMEMPVLGVCRGMQVLNVALGGTLYQDIQTQRPECSVHRDWEVYCELRHRVRFEPGSRLSRLYPGQMEATINTVHHQGVRELGQGLAVEARADDGIVEAVRYESAGFVYGVQWHPEFHDPADPELLDGRPILEMFLDAVAARRGESRRSEDRRPVAAGVGEGA